MPSASSRAPHPHKASNKHSHKRKKTKTRKVEVKKEFATTNINKSRINHIARFILLHAHLLFAMTGFAMISFGIYILATVWSVPTDFFRVTGIVVVLFGIILILIAHMGMQGIGMQNKRYGFWTGRKVICSYHLILTALMGCELYFLGVALRTVQQFQAVRNLQHLTTYPAYVGSQETIIASLFNELFFSAVHVCDPKKQIYVYMWDWVSNNCPSSLSLASCRACASYSITMCSADATACHVDSSDSSNMACPYNTCRANVLGYMSNRIYPVSYAVFALLCFQAIVYLLTTLIACHTPRDDMQTILAKSGLKVSNTMTDSIRMASARVRSTGVTAEYRALAAVEDRGADGDDIDDPVRIEDIEEGIAVEVEDNLKSRSAPAEKAGNKSPLGKSISYIANAFKSSHHSENDEHVAHSSSSDSVRYDNIYTGNRFSDAAIGENLNLVPHSSNAHSHLELGQGSNHHATQSQSRSTPARAGNLTARLTVAEKLMAPSPAPTSTSAVKQRTHSPVRGGNLTPQTATTETATTTATTSTSSTSSAAEHKLYSAVPTSEGGNLPSHLSAAPASIGTSTSGRNFNVIPSQHERLQSLSAAAAASHSHHKQPQRQHEHEHHDQRLLARNKNHDLL